MELKCSFHTNTQHMLYIYKKKIAIDFEAGMYFIDTAEPHKPRITLCFLIWWKAWVDILICFWINLWDFDEMLFAEL